MLEGIGLGILVAFLLAVLGPVLEQMSVDFRTWAEKIEKRFRHS